MSSAHKHRDFSRTFLRLGDECLLGLLIFMVSYDLFSRFTDHHWCNYCLLVLLLLLRLVLALIFKLQVISFNSLADKNLDPTVLNFDRILVDLNVN